MQRQQDYLKRDPSLALMRDLIELLDGSYTVAFGNSDQGLARLGQLQQAVSVQLPQGHPSISMVRYQLAEAYLGTGQFKDALRWYGRTLEALHDNPYGRKDIIAFMVSRQALALWQLQRTDEATVMAKSAFDLIKADRSAQHSTFSQVLDLYAALLAYENKNWKEAADLLRTYINDPAFFGKLGGNNQFYLVKRVAAFVAEYGTLDETLAALRKAEEMLAARFTGDKRFDHSVLLLDRARALYWESGDPRAGINCWPGPMRTSNSRAISSLNGGMIFQQKRGRRQPGQCTECHFSGWLSGCDWLGLCANFGGLGCWFLRGPWWGAELRERGIKGRRPAASSLGRPHGPAIWLIEA